MLDAVGVVLGADEGEEDEVLEDEPARVALAIGLGDAELENEGSCVSVAAAEAVEDPTLEELSVKLAVLLAVPLAEAQAVALAVELAAPLNEAVTIELVEPDELALVLEVTDAVAAKLADAVEVDVELAVAVDVAVELAEAVDVALELAEAVTETEDDISPDGDASAELKGVVAGETENLGVDEADAVGDNELVGAVLRVAAALGESADAGLGVGGTHEGWIPPAHAQLPSAALFISVPAWPETVHENV